MIRILVQCFSGENVHEGYEKSYQFRVTDKVTDDLALDILMDWLRTSRILIESEHREKV